KDGVPDIAKYALRVAHCSCRGGQLRTSRILYKAPKTLDECLAGRRAKANHSSRRRIAGSMERARWAGIQVATSPSKAIARTTPANTSGSRGVAWYTMKARTRLARIPSSNPAVEPNASNLKARPKAA